MNIGRVFGTNKLKIHDFLILWCRYSVSFVQSNQNIETLY